jgi:hypothetical protein
MNELFAQAAFMPILEVWLLRRAIAKLGSRPSHPQFMRLLSRTQKKNQKKILSLQKQLTQSLDPICHFIILQKLGNV